MLTVPTSSFLYRKVIHELVNKGYRGVAIDFPGFGFSDRSEDFDCSFPSLARFCAEAAKALGLDKYHLVVHDIGGPIGFALAAEAILTIPRFQGFMLSGGTKCSVPGAGNVECR